MSLYAEVDAEFWAQHPELNGRQLTMGPEDKYYRQEYMKILRQHQQAQGGGQSGGAPPTSSKPVCGTNPEPPPPADQGESEECTAQSLSISKSGSDFVLKIPGTGVEYGGSSIQDCRIYEVVAGSPKNPADISISVNGLIGPCSDAHKDKVFGVIQGDFISPSVADNEFKAKVSFREIPDDNSLTAFAELLSVCWGDDHIEHDIDYQTCGFAETCKLCVYPQLAVKASAALEFEWEWKKKGESFEREEGGGDSLRDKLKLELSAEYAGKSILSIKQGSEKSEEGEEPAIIKFLVELFNNLDYVRSGFGCFFSDSQKLTLGFSPKLEASAGLAEVPGKPFVDLEYAIDVGFDPLFSISGEADVSGKLIGAIPVIGPFLMAGIEAAESVEAVDVFVGFIVGGELKLTGTVKQDAGGTMSSSLSFTGNVKIKLEAHVKAEGTVCSVSYSFGAKAGAASGFTIEASKVAEDAQGIYVPIEIKFLGIVVYKQTWHSVGLSSESDAVPGFTTETGVSGVGQEEAEDVDDLEDTDKKTLLEPSTLYTGRFPLFGV